MEEIKSLIKKHTTSEQLEKQQNSSPQLSKRQAALIALIQQTQARRGLPLISAGFELQNVVLVAWEKALKNVPDSYLSRSYERAADNWNWTDGKAFTADAVNDAFKVLVVEDRQRDEAEARNAKRQSKDTYRCHHCQDIGYQPVFTFRMQRWYSSQRPCVCEATPIAQRNSMPLEEPEYLRGKLDEWVRVVDLEKHGAPTKAFEQFIAAKEAK